MKKAFLFFTIITGVILSCQKANNEEPKKINGKYFPNTTGDHWHYNYLATGSNIPIGTIDVNIIGDSILQPGAQNAKVWAYHYFITNPTTHHFYDTNYVVADDQLVKIYAHPCFNCVGIREDQRYILPLQTGNNWTWDFSQYQHDTTWVLSQSTITVPAGTFENTFRMFKARTKGPNYYVYDSIWLTPYIGLTKLMNREYDLGPMLGNGNWELESYSVR